MLCMLRWSSRLLDKESPSSLRLTSVQLSSTLPVGSPSKMEAGGGSGLPSWAALLSAFRAFDSSTESILWRILEKFHTHSGSLSLKKYHKILIQLQIENVIFKNFICNAFCISCENLNFLRFFRFKTL